IDFYNEINQVRSRTFKECFDEFDKATRADSYLVIYIFVIVFAITQGFIVFFFVGFISWAIWGVVSLFRSMVRG
ncbi:MAG: hypothetical protein RSB52_09150, partial [Acidaminococcaceae bacterium]